MLTERELAQILQIFEPVDLDTGAPDFLPPSFIRSAMWNLSISADPLVDQYSDYDGHPDLRRVIAKVYSNLINHDLYPNQNVIVTLGASEALFSTIQAFTSPGDEWIVIEPASSLYANLVEMAGGKLRFVQLKPTTTCGKISSRDWLYDKKEMARAFNRKTKGILINNPHNPTGKVFSKEELRFIGDLSNKWNTLVVSDEVYEWLVFKPNQLTRMASMSDVYQRSITISSASKTFSVSGWRVGWLYGPSHLLDNIRPVHRRVVYSNPTPAQMAVAIALDNFYEDLDQPHSYLSSYLKELQAKRNDLVDILEGIGMAPTVPEAAFYVTANFTALSCRTQLNDERDPFLDVRFTKWLAKNVGVLGAPGSRFYGNGQERLGENFIRFCFARKIKTLEKAAELLREWVQ